MPKGSVNDGAGYSKLTPSAATRNFIVKNDIPFTKQVVGHNDQCAQDKMCAK